MNLAAPASVSDDENEALDRLKAGARLFGSDTAFYDALYRNAASEDINRYTPEALAALAKLVLKRLKARQPGNSMVDLFNPSAEDKTYPVNECVLVTINDDMPFLFDSLTGELHAQGTRLRAIFHPIIDKTSIIVAILDPVVDETRQQTIVAGARAVFAQVWEAVRDWKKMLGKLEDSVAELKKRPPSISQDDLDESIAFLDWLDDNHFTFLGCRDYLYTSEGNGRLEPITDSGLGVLTTPDARVLRGGADRASLTPQIRGFLEQPEPLIITKANERSLVHRRVHMDYVGVKRFDDKGNLIGERRFVGLFTSSAYSRSPRDIPMLRRKVERVKEQAGLAPASHDGKALAHILDAYPRDELFQVSADELFHTAIGILKLGERPKVRVFLRFDRFDRFVSALVFVPRDRYDTHVREKIHLILAKAFHGRMSAAVPVLDDSALARVHYIIGRESDTRPDIGARELEDRIRAAIRTWDDAFADALAAHHGENEGARLYHAREAQFSPGYTGMFVPAEASLDLEEFEKLAARTGGLALQARAYRKPSDPPSMVRLKLYLIGEMMPLSLSLPIFENLGMKVIAEDSFTVSFKDEAGRTHDCVLLDFQMERADGGVANLDQIKAPLEEAFRAVVSSQAESDGFNKLVIGAGLAWRDVTILRAAAKYLRQAAVQFSQEYMEQALTRNPDIAGFLVELFHTLNNPADQEKREARTRLVQTKIDKALNDVPSLDDDRIIRRLRNVIVCVLRTNFYQKDVAVLAMKLDSQKLDELPAPRPLVEIFVYSPMVEGVHLRFGKVARGGIRWSDRREDFRTEVLSLVKAQQVKNAVIVPVGAKGGFYPKQSPVNATRDEVQAAGITAYKAFIGALLDVTDNLHHDGSIVPPPDCVRHDGDDPYLVVAADKGTATFSDIANGIAEGRGFWLGDAFASGGSHGYDHKKMGITARGAWEAVKRHFREMGRDTQNEPFTAIGVGDMSGDVFGNGMLLSKETRLLAAFDHRHIFIDPEPDAAKSFAERQRLFDLARSSWADYDKALISKGGGIFARTLKEIPLSAEIKALTGIGSDTATPAELMKALLKAPSDLLWFGGIGTYVKASSQSNAEAGDRANDGVRVNGADIRAKVIGEGANLGCTQLGRVEYAQAGAQGQGGRINTDAIDNSAGVDTSDHEVNLKILFSGPLRRGDLTPEARDTLLAEMTDDVAAHVLQDNYDQTLVLSVAQSRANKDLDAHGRFMRELESRGKLDRAVEFLPDDAQIRARQQSDKGLTRPELAVLLAYAKLDLKDELNASTLPDDPHFAGELASYFPDAAAQKFRDELKNHRLKREIVTDVLANRIVNLAGPVFVARMKEMTGASGAEVVRVSVVAEGAFGLSRLKARVDALDGKVDASVQTSMYTDIAELLRRLGLWFLANVPANADFASTIALYRDGVEKLKGTFEGLVSPYERQDTVDRIAELENAGVPHAIADEIGALPLFGTAPEIAQLAYNKELGVDLVAGAYFAIGAEVGIDRLRGLSRRIVGAEHWDRLAIRRLNDDLFAAQRALTGDALALLDPAKKDGTRVDGAAAAKEWVARNQDKLARARDFLTALEASGDLSIAKLTLANSQIRELAAR